MLINFHTSLITKRCFRSFDHQSDKTVTLSNYFQTSINSVMKLWIFSESFTNVPSKLFELLWYTCWTTFLNKCPPVSLSQFFFYNGSQNRAHLLIFCTPWSQPLHVTASLPSPGYNHQSTAERSELTQGPAKMAAWNSFSSICTWALHSVRSFSIVAHPPPSFHYCPRPHSHHPSSLTSVSLVPVLPLITSAINTLLAIRFSSIISTCPNHLNTLWSETPFLFQLCSLLLKLLKLTLHLKNIRFLSLRTSHTPCLCSVQRSWYNYSFI